MMSGAELTLRISRFCVFRSRVMYFGRTGSKRAVSRKVADSPRSISSTKA